ncbi:MAG: DEAD/DEAH box helicase [Synergistaceae bacterium]|nr:DEAD/DEAH box helicase [Synergistaceae bacterium]
MLRKPRKRIEELLKWIESRPGEVSVWRTFPSQAAAFGTWPALDARLTNALALRGIERPYLHQAEAIDAALRKKSVVVVTPTASGKTLCYNVPVVQSILEDPASRALYLFPTKALSQDQLAELTALLEGVEADIACFTYDGDTAPSARTKVRTAGHVVITNPDMLHTGILPHHTKWVKLFENLRYVVLDEMHGYRGVFGSHLANVIRRLKRICAFYGSSPTFICCSATISNPRELAEALLEEPVVLVTRNGAPRDEKHVLIQNPPLVNRSMGIRGSSLDETAAIATEALANEISTIVFTRSRTNVELLLHRIRTNLQARALPSNQVAGYRGGYLPNERRAIEKGLRGGQIRGVVSTNALELGIDIGSLELAVLHGYPGSIASAWQQMGRAGRRQGASAAVLVASSFALDQFLASQPSYFFGASPERARVNPDNLYILVNHVKCAAFELPFRTGDRFGKADISEILEYLEEQRVLHRAEGRYHWQADSFPAEGFSLRSATSENVVIIDISDPARHTVVGEVDRPSAPMLVHPEAIYFHGAKAYQVQELDFKGMRALVRPVEAEYYTDADLAVRLEVLEEFDRSEPWGWGEVLFASRPTVYKKIRLATQENVGYGHIHLDEEQMHTTGAWLTLPDSLPWGNWDPDRKSSALAGLAHLLRATAPLFLMCDRGDLQVHGMVRDPHFERPTLYLADNFPGGVGLAEAAFTLRKELLDSAWEALVSCPCEKGCPACVGALGSQIGSKEATRALLSSLRGMTA